MRHILSSKSGFTLVELALSMAILLIVVGPLASYFITSSANNNRANLQLEANQLAEQYMEEWKRSGQVQLDPAKGTPMKLDPIAKGKLEIYREAEVKTNAMAATGGPESPVPTQKPDPYAETKVTLPDPVPEASAIENYNMNSGNVADELGSDLTGSLILRGNQVSDTSDSSVFKDCTKLVINQNANSLKVSYVNASSQVDQSLTTNSQVSMVILCETEAPRPIEVIASQIPMKIYLVRGLKSDGTPYPEPAVSVASGLSNVQVFKNLTQKPANVDGQRLYKLTVSVKRAGAPETEPALVILTSYMRTK